MTSHENHNAPVTKRRSFRSRAPSVSTREQEFASRFWTPNMDSNFFRPLFDAVEARAVERNRFAVAVSGLPDRRGFPVSRH